MNVKPIILKIYARVYPCISEYVHRNRKSPHICSKEMSVLGSIAVPRHCNFGTDILALAPQSAFKAIAVCLIRDTKKSRALKSSHTKLTAMKHPAKIPPYATKDQL
jgi:hypothetical protein